MTSAWVVRAGRNGEHEQWNLESGRATIGWEPIGDLSGCSSRRDVQKLVDATYSDKSTQSRGMQTGQLWAFRSSIQPNDLVVMPLKTEPGYLAFGRCVGGYGYDAAGEPNRRHFLPVEWRPERVAKAAIKDDLLATLNGLMTVFSPSRNSAAARLEAVWSAGSDPGSVGVTPPPQPSSHDAPEVTDPQTVPTLDAIRDRVLTHVVENFGGHKLTHLVKAILEAQGFVCDLSPEGPDGGCDILASHGPLGFGTPTIVVEVKSETTQVKSEVLRTLHSAVTRYSADRGLLVALGGVNRQAQTEFRHLRAIMPTWDAAALLDRLFEVYPRLPDDIKAALPLKQAWVLDDESEG